LDKQVKILDCPGVIFDNDNQQTNLLKNALKIEQMEDAISPVEEIIKKV